VERTGNGYRLAEPMPTIGRGPWGRQGVPHLHGSPLVELRLANAGSSANILGLLAGRWFGEFRWVGSYEVGGRTTLLWVSRHSMETLGLVLEGDLLRIFLQTPQGRTVVDRPTVAYELLQLVLTALRSSERRTSLLPLSVEDRDFPQDGLAL
jgi:hypothetical protein